MHTNKGDWLSNDAIEAGVGENNILPNHLVLNSDLDAVVDDEDAVEDHGDTTGLSAAQIGVGRDGHRSTGVAGVVESFLDRGGSSLADDALNRHATLRAAKNPVNLVGAKFIELLVVLAVVSVDVLNQGGDPGASASSNGRHGAVRCENSADSLLIPIKDVHDLKRCRDSIGG